MLRRRLVHALVVRRRPTMHTSPAGPTAVTPQIGRSGTGTGSSNVFAPVETDMLVALSHGGFMGQSALKEKPIELKR